MKFNEQQIKERRTVEAIQKEYMGFQGKFFCIAKNLGSEILDQGSKDQTFLSYDNFWGEEEEIPTIDEESSISFLGWHYDALKMGSNLEIFVYDNEKRIRVSYNGVTVYEESSGELEMFVPNKVWEEKIKYIYELAKNKQKDKKQTSKENAKIEFERKKKNILDELNYKWGI